MERLVGFCRRPWDDETMEHEEIYRATLAKWGEEAQYDQAVEECAELITALKHFRRGKADAAAVVAELADVTLMLGQLSYMFGPQHVAAALETKLLKLRGLLNE